MWALGALVAAATTAAAATAAGRLFFILGLGFFGMAVAATATATAAATAAVATAWWRDDYAGEGTGEGELIALHWEIAIRENHSVEVRFRDLNDAVALTGGLIGGIAGGFHNDLVIALWVFMGEKGEVDLLVLLIGEQWTLSNIGLNGVNDIALTIKDIQAAADAVNHVDMGGNRLKVASREETSKNRIRFSGNNDDLRATRIAELNELAGAKFAHDSKPIGGNRGIDSFLPGRVVHADTTKIRFGTHSFIY